MIGKLMKIFVGLIFFTNKVSSTGYIGVSTTMTWSNAESYCQSTYGTSLATITSSDDNSAAIAAADLAGITGTFWIGLSDISTEGTWVWNDGTSTYYTFWDVNEPNGNTNENCGLARWEADGSWNDRVCGDSRSFVCNYPLYTGVSIKLTWSEAESYCNSYGYNLATITNEDSNNFAYNEGIIANNNDGSDIWIGLYDSGSNNWNWIDGITSYIYTNWNSGQPDHVSELCGEFEGGLGWNNAGCTGQNYFVCNGDFIPQLPTFNPSPIPTYIPTAPTYTPTSVPSEIPSIEPSTNPTHFPSHNPTAMPTHNPSTNPSYHPSYNPSHTPTAQPTNYECDIIEDDLIVSWDDLFGDISSANLSSKITLIQGIDDISGIFEVTVNVESKYIIGATYENYKNKYESITENGYLGVTYMLDTNKFDNEGRLLSNPNTCENRLSSSYDNKDFLTDYWDYTLYPGINGNLGNDNYLEYGNQNIWDITLLGDEPGKCGNVQWTNTFSFDDLWNVCKNKNGDKSYELIETDTTISLNYVFYLQLVSPNPLYLTLCDNGNSDCGQYLSTTLISHPLSIIFSKSSLIISNKDDVFIDLFTSNIISSLFTEESILTNTSAVFKLTLITSVPYFMSLNIDTALILSPTENELENNNGNIDFISNYYIIEDIDSYMNDNCLIETQYRCFQKFEIVIELSQCPSDTGLLFDGSYFFSADFDCIETNDATICDDYLSDEPLSITLDNVNLEFNELCDSTLYEIDWNGDISFYSDNTFSETQNEYTFGDTVYTRVSISNDIKDYSVFGMSIVQCYVCTSNISDDSSNVLDTCLNANVDNGLFYTMPDDTDLSFTLINSDITDIYEDFSFILPAVADDIFYVDCTIELEVNNNNNVRRRRTQRMLLQSNNNGNLFKTYIGSANVITNNGDNTSNDNNNSNESNLFSEFYVILIGLFALIIILIGIIFYFILLRNNKNKNNNTLNKALEIVNKKNELPVITKTNTNNSSVEGSISTSIKMNEMNETPTN